MTNGILTTLRVQAWERAKGEMHAALQAVVARLDMSRPEDQETYRRASEFVEETSRRGDEEIFG